MKSNTFVIRKVEFPWSRVVYRGYNNANANGGVSNANANNDSSNSDTNRGSRLNNNLRKLKSVYDTGDLSPPLSRGERASVTAPLQGGKLKKQTEGGVW